MVYRRPERRPLNARQAAGDAQNCGSGSAANALWNEGGFPCTTGVGYGTGPGGGCGEGIGAGWACRAGTAAAIPGWPTGDMWCELGTIPWTMCGAGGSPGTGYSCGGGNEDAP